MERPRWGRVRRASALAACIVAVACGGERREVDRLYRAEKAGRLELPVLAAALKSGSPDVRATAAAMVGRLGKEEGLPLLGAAARDDDAGVRAAVAGALGRLGSEGAAPALEPLTRDPIPLVRRRAVQSLGLIHAPAGRRRCWSCFQTPTASCAAQRRRPWPRSRTPTPWTR